MRKVEIFIKIIITTIMVITFMLIVDIFIVSYIAVRSGRGLAYPPLSRFAGQFEITSDEWGNQYYTMSQQGMDEFEGFDVFAFLLNDAGDVAWSYRLPSDVPTHYTLKEVVQFTRFYLNEYPVFVRIIDEGVMVIGLPKYTVWKYQLAYPSSMINKFINTFPVLFIVNVVMLLIAPFLIIRHDARRREMQRTEWIAGVSHDVRTPLSLVLGYADEIINCAHEDMENVTEKAQMIESQAMRIRTLVANLNMENKLTYGMGIWHRERVLLPAIIREAACDIINRNLDEKYDISVIISENLEQMYVNGDKELIKRLMENLINNSINHNPNGCEITISLTSEKALFFQRAILEISDNGCGVSKEQLKNFHNPIKSDKLPEHGLGIRLVRQIAAFHHWKVKFFNNKDRGFCCRIRFIPLIYLLLYFT